MSVEEEKLHQSTFLTVNAQLRLHCLDDDDHWLAFEAGKLPIFTTGWLEDIHNPHNWVVPFTTGFYGDKEALPGEVQAQFKAITDRGVAENDPVKRAAIYHEFNQLFYEQATMILLAV